MHLRGPIIAIDDDEDDQYLLAQAIGLLTLPNEVRFFSNGQEALDYLEATTERPFMILCDINMPVMNGIELSKRIQASPYLRKKAIPFIYLTTSADPALIAAAYEAMVQGYYQKPATFEELRSQVRDITSYWTHCLRPIY